MITASGILPRIDYRQDAKAQRRQEFQLAELNKNLISASLHLRGLAVSN
jgi:hypothetical protein